MMRSVCVLLFAMALASVGAAPLKADFVYADFSTTPGLQLNGAATSVGSALRLTQTGSVFQGGSVFTASQLPLGNLSSFSTYFQFLLTEPAGNGDEDGPGADGIVFVIQTVNNNVGTTGGGIGYQGINPSLGIEFDTYNNSEISGNHVGIDLNGSLNSIVAVAEPTRFNNSRVWNAWVDYNGVTDNLEVRWSQAPSRPTVSQLSATVDLQGILGQNTAYLGFTSATGASSGNHDLLTWEYRDEFAPIRPMAVPEPGSLALLSIGSLVLVVASYRKRSNSLVAGD